MLDYLAQFVAKYPEVAVYLALGIGFWIGKYKFGGFSLGGTTGSLLAGIVLGIAFDVKVPGTAKSFVFLLFLFGIGYEVGPQFVAAMKNNGWRVAALGVFMPVVGLITAWIVARYLGLSPGFSAGMLSGALTESPAMGTAVEAIHALPVDAALKETWAAQVGVADALCYLGGALGVIIFCSAIAPRLLGIDLREEARKLEAAYGITRPAGGIFSAWQQFEYRAYRLAPAAPAVGLTVAEAEKRLPGLRLFVERLRRGDQILEAQPDTRLQAGDVALVCGPREALVNILGGMAEEVEDRKLHEIPLSSSQVFVTSPALVGRTLADVAKDDVARGVFLKRLVRQGTDVPFGTGTVVQRGDVLHVVGSDPAVARVAKAVGELVAPIEATDFVAVGLAIFLGALFGVVASCTIVWNWAEVMVGV